MMTMNLPVTKKEIIEFLDMNFENLPWFLKNYYAQLKIELMEERINDGTLGFRYV